MSDPNDLAAFLADAWQHVTRGVADSRSPARYPTFATVSPQGKPEARTVALRAASPSKGTLDVHTDIETPKVTALRHAPQAALHFWVPRADLQIRFNADVAILSGAEVEDQWAKVPPGSRVSYGTQPVPGTPIPQVHAYQKPADRSRFAVLRCTLTEIDLVQLGSKHRRAAFTREDGWHGVWLAP